MWRVIVLVVLILIIGALGGAGLYFNRALNTPAGSLNKSQAFIIDKNTPSSKVAQELHQQRLIRSPLAFIIYLKLRRLQLQAGRYSLSPSMTIPAITSKFSNGEVEGVTVTFPEGWRLSQMAERLGEKELISKADFLQAAEGKEGYLFPDTYTFPMNAAAEDIIATMRQNFDRRTSGLEVTPDVVILASIVEREASKDEDRPMVAGVYTNRLKDGLRLEADPTIQYAKGSWAEITAAEYKSVLSPYNTYLHAGLTPGPICNPGLKSIQAALEPAKHDYYYFFHTQDGRTVYSSTLDEHNRNKAQYLR